MGYLVTSTTEHSWPHIVKSRAEIEEEWKSAPKPSTAFSSNSAPVLKPVAVEFGIIKKRWYTGLRTTLHTQLLQ